MTRLRAAHIARARAFELRRRLFDEATQATQAMFAADQEYARAKAMHALDCPALDDVETPCDCEPVEAAADDTADARKTVRQHDI